MSQPWLHLEAEETPEGSTVVVRGTIVDDSEPPVELGLADLTTLAAWMYEKNTPDQPIDGWENRDVLNVNGGTFDGTSFALRIPPGDTLMSRPQGVKELRVLQLRWTYNEGEDSGYAEITFAIRNRPFVGPTS